MSQGHAFWFGGILKLKKIKKINKSKSNFQVLIFVLVEALLELTLPHYSKIQSIYGYNVDGLSGFGVI